MKTIDRNDFPLLTSYQVNGKPLIYFDNAATTQKPLQVLKAEEDYYKTQNANPLRGFYNLGIEATKAYEDARHTVASFINAKDKEIVFTRNTTESINLIMYSYALNVLKPGDEIVISILEHHSNQIPWQQAAKMTGATLKYLYSDKEGIISEEEIEEKITDKTKIVAFTHVSNVLGVMPPAKKIIAKAHEVGAIVVLDCAQSIAHTPIDVKEMDMDFAVFSGHKIYGPMGIGVLYGKYEILKDMPPFLTGGEMIETVQEQSATFAEVPERFEAGTQNAAGAIGLASALSYLSEIGFEQIIKTEEELMKYLMDGLNDIPEVTIFGSKDAKQHHGVVSFQIKDVHPHDVATILNEDGIAIRAGHHCAHPLMQYLGVHATCRASISFYNTKEEVDYFINKLKQVRRWLGYGS